MKKLVITENQLNMIKSSLNENINNDRYERVVKVNVGIGGSPRYENMTLEDITTYFDEMRLTYLIEQEHRSWGIKDISLTDIQGYNEIEVELHLYPDNSDEPIIKEVKIPLDWSKLEKNTIKGDGFITVGDRLDIRFYLVDGKFETEMEIEVYSL
jgi:hypothetical protein